MLHSVSLARDASVGLPAVLLRGAQLVAQRIATGPPALSLLHRWQLLRLAKQTARAVLLGSPALVVGHAPKLPADRTRRNPAQAGRFLVRLATLAPPKMQVRGSYSNQRPGSINAFVLPVLAALANQEARACLDRLAKKLARLRISDAAPRVIKSCRKRTRRPGWVRDAVVQALADHGGPMRVADIHAAVKALVGEDVSPNSVSWALAADVGRPAPIFVRVARGRYALA